MEDLHVHLFLMYQFYFVCYLLFPPTSPPLSFFVPDGITPEVAVLLDAVLFIRVNMRICNSAHNHHCYCWHITSFYDFLNGGNVRLSLAEHIESPCHNPTFWDFFHSYLNLLNLIILVLGLVYIILIIKSMVASAALYFRVRETYLHHSQLGTFHPLINK